MPRIVRVIENVIAITAGQLPAAGAGWWYSGRGADKPGGDPGSTSATGVNAGGQANLFTAHFTVTAWDAAADGIEIRPEMKREGGAWGPVAWSVDDADGIHANAVPALYQILKADHPTAPVTVAVPIPVLAQYFRLGVRSLGTGTATAFTVALETAVND